MLELKPERLDVGEFSQQPVSIAGRSLVADVSGALYWPAEDLLIVADLLLVPALVYDWRTRGRPHPVYLVGLPLLLAQQLLTIPLSQTAAWMSVARWVEGLAG